MNEKSAQVGVIRLYYSGGLWVGVWKSGRYGAIEVFTSGDDGGPEAESVNSLRAFFNRPDDKIEEVRRCIPWSFFYYPIRITPNQDHRVGIQFRNWSTGNQQLMKYVDP
jgi:hypothetical protein